jgi:hypothetical protein
MPFDREASNSWLLSKDIPANLLQDWLWWWVGIKFLRIVLVVDIVTHTDKFPTVVGTSKEDNGYAQYFSVRNFVGFGWVGFEDELVHTDWNRTDEEGVELLVVLVAVSDI